MNEETTPALPTVPATRRWRKRLLIGGPVLLSFCVLGPWLYGYLEARGQLQEAIAEADRLDPGWRLPELEAKRAVVSDEENSALVLAEAAKLMPERWPSWDDGSGSEKSDASNNPDVIYASLQQTRPPIQLNDKQIHALRSWLKRASNALQKARKLTDMIGGRFPSAVSTNYLAGPPSHLQAASRVVDLLWMDALLRAQDRDPEGALASCGSMIGASRSIGDEPSRVSALTRHAADTLAAEAIERTLAQGQPSEFALTSMQQVLEAETKCPLFLFAMRGERAQWECLMEGIQSGELTVDKVHRGLQKPGRLEALHWRLPGYCQANRAAILHANNQLVEIAKRPPEEWRAAIKAFAGRPDLARAHQSFEVLGSPPGWTNTTEYFCRHQAVLRSGLAMLAAERYRQARGRWPESLSDLVPAYLNNVPIDPFDGAPLRLARFADGIVVYSVGPDGVDNGGQLDTTQTEWDIGYRLWDPAKRRQPPKPPEPPPTPRPGDD